MLSTGLLTNERTGTCCGFTFRARAFRAFLVLFYLLVICACPRWLLAVGRTWRLQQYSTRARVIRGNQTGPFRRGRKYTPSKNNCRPRGTKLYASKSGTILETRERVEHPRG